MNSSQPDALPACQPVADRLAIIGVGLMGGSLGLALIEAGCVRQVLGFDRPDVLQQALAAGAIHTPCAAVGDAVSEADLIVLAAPVFTIPDLLQEIAPFVRPEAQVTDLASVKAHIVAAGESTLGFRFIGGHPMAGSEQTGISAASATLYKNAPWALTPVSGGPTSECRVDRLRRLVTAAGAVPIVMTPASHDAAAALISHLPHLICYAYNRTVAGSSHSADALPLAAGSYRDLTRIVASDPVLWRDVFMENRLELLEALRGFKTSLEELEEAVESADANKISQAIAVAAHRAADGQPGKTTVHAWPATVGRIGHTVVPHTKTDPA